MPESRAPLITIGVDYVCDECKVGTMRFTGECRTSIPPQYTHRCEGCGTTTFFNRIYPGIEYRPTDKQTNAQSPQSQVGNIDEI